MVWVLRISPVERSMRIVTAEDKNADLAEGHHASYLPASETLGVNCPAPLWARSAHSRADQPGPCRHLRRGGGVLGELPAKSGRQAIASVRNPTLWARQTDPAGSGTPLRAAGSDD
jgi:hypothetical protein